MQMNLHELNSSIIERMPRMKEEEIANAKDCIREWIDSSKCSYYMLLSNEKRDYTVFKISSRKDSQSLVDQIFKVIDTRGNIRACDRADNAFEIWINSNFYALFEYDAAVIEV